MNGDTLFHSASLPPSVQALNLTLPPSPFPYRALAEAFVSGHGGSSSWEVVGQTSAAALALATRRVAGCLVAEGRRRGAWWARWIPPFASASAARGASFHALLPSFALDWSLLLLPLLLSCTLAADHLATMLLAQVGLLVALVLVHRVYAGAWCVRLPPFLDALLSSGASSGVSASDRATLQRLNASRKRFVGDYRTTLMLGTCVAILAVDFVVFPRRYCKTETFGYSLMDAGVGSFIVSHALTSVQARGGASSSSDSRNGASATQRAREGLRSSISRILRSTAPLLALGFARLLTVRAVDYQSHVSEYGVHWNFFFTLACVAILSAATSRSMSPKQALWAGAGLALVYQLFLSVGGLGEFILHAPRVSLLSANKEGVCSAMGYLALYLVSLRLGHELVAAKEASLQAWRSKWNRLAVWNAILWLLTGLCSALIESPSRRMVNLSYIVWMLALNLTLLLQFLLVDLCIDGDDEGEDDAATSARLKDDKERAAAGAHSTLDGSASASTALAAPAHAPRSTSSMLLEAVNKNSLAFFLLCNQCTGAINLATYTILASDRTAIMLLVLYTLITTLCMLYVDYRGWRLKL